MKSEIIEKKDEVEKPFPKIMSTDRKTVVLFTEERCGTVLLSRFSYHQIGYYAEDWCMSDFKDFDGQIKLENS